MVIMKINPLEIYKSIRKTWKINPQTKIRDKKRKSRQQTKMDLKKEL